MRSHSPGLRWVMVCCFVALAMPEVARACGDKLIVLGHGVRFESIAESRYPGTIVLYLNPQSRLPQADEQFHLAAVLELAGHTVVEVESRAGLDRALLDEHPDVVVADLVDVRTLRAELPADSAAPILMPVLYKPSEAELAEAQAQVSCLGKAAKGKRRQLLRTVEDLLERRAKGLPTDCRAAAAAAGKR